MCCKKLVCQSSRCWLVLRQKLILSKDPTGDIDLTYQKGYTGYPRAAGESAGQKEDLGLANSTSGLNRHRSASLVGSAVPQNRLHLSGVPSTLSGISMGTLLHCGVLESCVAARDKSLHG